MKLTIEPISPGRREPNFCPIVLSPFPTAFVPALSPFIAARATAPRTKPAARTTACSVQPYFLKILLTLSRKGNVSSLCWICGANLSIASSRFALGSAAACFSLSEAFGSSIIFWSSSFSRWSVSYRSSSSSSGFVLLTPASVSFLSLTLVSYAFPCSSASFCNDVRFSSPCFVCILLAVIDSCS